MYSILYNIRNSAAQSANKAANGHPSKAVPNAKLFSFIPELDLLYI